jgi:type II secretory pathway pseudopilin PulG
MVKGTNEMTSLSTLARAARLGSTRKRGVTLIEAVLYISIALALIVGGLVFFQQASLAQRTNSAVRNVSALASETRALYQASSSFAGFSTSTLIDAGAAPSSIINGANLQNEWGGAILAEPSNVDGIANDGFSVTYENLPLAACVRLASYDANGSGRVGSGIDEVRFRVSALNGLPSATAYTAASAAQLAGGIDPTEASTLCNANDDAGGVDLEFRFDR